MIRIQNLSKSFGAQLLFDDATFNINPKEKIGLVGRNGHGKTTLMRVLTGEDHPDSGDIDIAKGYRIGYITQHLKFTATTVRDEAALGLPEHDSDEVWRAEKILSGLGFSKGDFDRSPFEFSGGYQVRLHLSKVLVSDPDLLLLDEPTNYLDITSIRWLEQFLRTWPKELMLITHDRAFMDAVCTHTVVIHRKKIRKVSGDTSKLYEQIAKEEEIWEKTRLNDEKKRKETEEFINRFRAKARLAGLVQSRIKNLERMEKRDKLEKVTDLEFSFREAPFEPKNMMQVKEISFGYDKDNLLFKDFSLNVAKGDRICIVGRNGKGKTTLLKVLAGEYSPLEGSVNAHSDMRMGYFTQTNVSTLEPNRTVEEEIFAADPASDRSRARGIAGAMMFEGDNALKRIEVLSGGEKSRVMLGKIIMKPVNILLLDEPTNHLDMQSCDALLESIDSFDGAVIVVTHNEMFLHAIANRMVLFQSGNASVFEGSYEAFLEKVGWEEERLDDGSAPVKSEGDSLNKKETRKIRSEIITRRNKTMKPVENRIRKLEDSIVKSEEESEKLTDELVTASAEKNGARCQEISKRLHDLAVIVENAYNDLDAATKESDRLSAEFESELASLGCQVFPFRIPEKEH
jgi:ATP-binding cassette subfamily F protein 3